LTELDEYRAQFLQRQAQALAAWTIRHARASEPSAPVAEKLVQTVLPGDLQDLPQPHPSRDSAHHRSRRASRPSTSALRRSTSRIHSAISTRLASCRVSSLM